MKNYLRMFISLAVLAIMLFSLCACTGNGNIDIVIKPDEDFQFTHFDMLHTSRTDIFNEYGQPITLRGTNAGGYLVLEQWMTAFAGSDATGYLDHQTTNDVFLERFGTDKTLELWKYYRDMYWTEQDFINCAEMGMNAIRLPFSYMTVDTDYYNVEKVDGQQYNFRLLDEFVAMAEKYGMYTILDLHGAYGSHNGQDHCGESLGSAEEVDFFYNEEKMSKTTDLWVALAEHYKDNPAIAGYDLLNEPGEKGALTTTRHWEFYDRLYKAVRKVDSQHIIIIESCWDGKDFPAPIKYDWITNVVYSVHNYSGTTDYEENQKSMVNKINGVYDMNFNVPYYMGEFNCYTTEKSWVDSLKLFNDELWSWTSWTYKVNRLSTQNTWAWGIYNTYAEPVTPDVDSYDDIIAKWKNLKTTSDKTITYTFESGKTLKQIMTDACSITVE